MSLEEQRAGALRERLDRLQARCQAVGLEARIEEGRIIVEDEDGSIRDEPYHTLAVLVPSWT